MRLHWPSIYWRSFFEPADQPIVATVSVDEETSNPLLEAMAKEPINVAYIKVPVEFGRVGTEMP